MDPKMDPKWTPKRAPRGTPKWTPKWTPIRRAKTKVFHWFYNKKPKSEAKDGKRQLMTRGPSVVLVSLQRDAFCLVRLYKKRETCECMHLFAFSLHRVLAHAMIFACYFCRRCSPAAFADYPGPLLHVAIIRCVHSLILRVFVFPRYSHSLFSRTISDTVFAHNVGFSYSEGSGQSQIRILSEPSKRAVKQSLICCANILQGGYMCRIVRNG